MKKMWRLTAIACAYTVAGCGGGGDGGAGATTLAFPLAKGYAALIVAGEATTFDVSGTCSGIATLTSNPATTASFDGEPMLAVADTKTLQLVNCTPSTSSSSWTNYYDLQFALAGSVSAASTVYGFVPTPRQPLPDTVRVGDSGIRETLFAYTDSSKTALYGRTERSYLVEADSANTAIVNFIARDYDASGRLMETVQSRYRIDAGGALIRVSVDYQWSTISTTHLLLTRSG